MRLTQHERLRAGLNVTPLDSRARRHEGEIPIGYVPDDEIVSEHEIRKLERLVWLAACAAALLTGYSLGRLIAEPIIAWWLAR